MEEENNYKNRIIGMYILILYTITLLRSIGEWNLVPTYIDSAIFAISGLIGGIIILYEFYEILLKKEKFNFDPMLILFLIVFGISIILNRQFTFIANIKNFCWEVLFLLVLYQFSKKNALKEKFFLWFQTILVSFSFVMSMISLGMFFVGYSFITKIEGKTNPLRIGFVENRLFGAYADPNYSGVMAGISIIISIFLFKKIAKSLILKIALILNIAIQISFIGLSGSRNALIVLVVMSTVLSFFTVFWKLSNYNKLKKFFVSFVAAILMGIVCFGVIETSRNILIYIPEYVSPVINQDSGKKSLDNQSKSDREINLNREDVERSGDISNMRFTLWKSGLDIFKSKPFFGVGPKSIHDYAQKYLPNTYLAKSNLAVHNAYLNVLVCTGLFGGMFILVFLLKSLIRILQYAFSTDILNSQFMYSAVAILGIAISGFFHNEIFFMSTSSPLVFWVLIGQVNGTIYYDRTQLEGKKSELQS
ncbi:O-antigen ligase family protein [Enterococcus dongliensis]|uniref:O-antigen ligase family protein n=1 Tax=Enterococcus dongliensis TaxID=2559925 RepID=UPI002891DD7B|nr:O-antigen ligase family protein [Enterococcus dongliensis]MDT2670803.1 O-antigen ligase family protein [Enterococcus dongliensis]